MSDERDPPNGAYAAIIGTFAAALAFTATRRRAPRETSALDMALLSAAAFKASRALARERVGSVVREPFVESDGPTERPAGVGVRRALGELVTCTRCVGTWATAGLVAVDTVAPRFGRVLTITLAASGGNDFLHAAFAALCARSAGQGTTTPVGGQVSSTDRGHEPHGAQGAGTSSMQPSSLAPSRS